jgi:Cu/Ag efflux pump CusA
MSVVSYVLRRPYTVAAALILICLLGIGAGLRMPTALMILLFLGNWRLTLIILASIPLSIITAILIMYVNGQTLNTMTLGGFALAVGILVDNPSKAILVTLSGWEASCGCFF